MDIKKNRGRIEKNIDELTLFDDDLMSRVFDGNIEATTLLLRIILKREDIRVLSVIGQEELKSPIVGGRNIKLDILAEDEKGIRFNVEVQRNTEGSHVRRARFHSSVLDSGMLQEKEKFKELKDTYVIFICEHDKFGAEEPIYHVDRMVRETGEKFADGSHIIYVNGKYKGNDPIGKLMHDFNCKRSEDMYYAELSNGLKHFKETEKGREIMCERFEALARELAAEEIAEAAAKKTIEVYKKALEMGLTQEDAKKLSGITEEQLEKLLCVK